MDRSAQAAPVMGWVGRIVLAAVFVYAGAAKALDPAAFADAIDSYRLLPHPAGWRWRFICLGSRSPAVWAWSGLAPGWGRSHCFFCCA